jgi:hypothetical protein
MHINEEKAKFQILNSDTSWKVGKSSLVRLGIPGKRGQQDDLEAVMRSPLSHRAHPVGISPLSHGAHPVEGFNPRNWANRSVSITTVEQSSFRNSHFKVHSSKSVFFSPHHNPEFIPLFLAHEYSSKFKFQFFPCSKHHNSFPQV